MEHPVQLELKLDGKIVYYTVQLGTAESNMNGIVNSIH